MIEPISDWIEVVYHEIPDEMKEYTHEEDWWQPCFDFNEKRYWLSEFTRCHNNPWGNLNVPDYIHGYETMNYFDPLFISINDSSEFVKVYSNRRN